jgi:ketosteroid isomerase-like protein
MQMIKSITAAFDAHDLDGVLAHFVDDAVFEGPRGPDRWGQRFVDKQEVRDAFAARSPGSPISVIRMMSTSSTVTVGPRNGPCPVHRRPGSASKSEAVTYGRFETAWS